MYSNFRSTIVRVSILVVCLLLLNFNYAEADDSAAVRVMNTAGGGVVNIAVKNISDNQPAANGLITWSDLQAGQTTWKVANQYIEISPSNLPVSWGIQVYTDNKNSAPAYTGGGDPAGLVNVSNTASTIPLAWRITDKLLATSELVNLQERLDGKGMADYLWHFIKDKNTPNNPATTVNESFVDGDDYVTIWNQKGISWNESGKSGNPAKAYLYLAARFTTVPVGVEYKTTALTLEAYHGVTPFPFYLYKDGTPAIQMAYEHINAKMDKYFVGAKKRLIESYSDPYPPGHGHLPGHTGSVIGVAFTYDNALAICAYLARPTAENLFRARLLCNTFIWAQDHDAAADGRFRDAYDATGQFTGITPPAADNFYSGSNTGNIAWVINALMQYYKNSNDQDNAFLTIVLNAATQAAEFIHTKFYDSTQAGYYYGFNTDGSLNRSKSTEHNIAAYVAFSHLYDITREDKWLQRANNAKNFVENIAWRSGDKRYICGLDSSGNPNLNTLVADTNLLPVFAISTPGRRNDAMNFVINNFKYPQGAVEEGTIEGIDFGYDVGEGEPDGIWFEGTAQLAAAYKVVGNSGEANRYLESIKLAQHTNFRTDIAGYNPDFKSIVAASKDNLTTGLGWSFYASPSMAATVWFAATKLDYNLFWGTSLSSTVPSPGDNARFSADPSSLIDKTDYLQNHYYPSGFMNYAPGVLSVDDRCTDNPHSGETCFKIHWNGQAGADGWQWAGLLWQEPENEWFGGLGKGYDLRGADCITFWARTDSYSYIAGKTFKIQAYFGYEPNIAVPGSGDSCGQTILVWCSPALTTSWQQYIIPVLSRDMSHVSDGLTILFNDTHTPRSDKKCNVYIDDIEYQEY